MTDEEYDQIATRFADGSYMGNDGQLQLIRDAGKLLDGVRLLKAEQAIVYCTFCGYEYKLGKVRGRSALKRAAMSDAMAVHIAGCEKHPMRQAVIENQRLHAENKQWAARIAELEQAIKDYAPGFVDCERDISRPPPGPKE